MGMKGQFLIMGKGLLEVLTRVGKRSKFNHLKCKAKLPAPSQGNAGGRCVCVCAVQSLEGMVGILSLGKSQKV